MSAVRGARECGRPDFLQEQGCHLRRWKKNCPTWRRLGMPFANSRQELPHARPSGDVICMERVRIAPHGAWWGCHLREGDKKCPRRSLPGMSFVGRRQELPRARLTGDVVCMHWTIFAPCEACWGCHLRDEGKNCPARRLSELSFVKSRQQLFQAESCR